MSVMFECLCLTNVNIIVFVTNVIVMFVLTLNKAFLLYSYNNCSAAGNLLIIMMDSCLKLPLEEEQLKDLVSQAKDYLLSHGRYVFKIL